MTSNPSTETLGPDRAAPTFDLTDPEFCRDPYRTYARLRANAPALRTEQGYWVISRHADCAAILKDRRWSSDSRRATAEGVFSEPSEVAQMEVEVRPYLFYDPPVDAPTRPFLFLDPPEHTRFRALVSGAFKASALERFRPRVEHLAESLIGRATQRGEIEVVSDLAYPLPVAVICELLGVPVADESLFHRWSPLLAGLIEPDYLRSGGDREKAREALGEAGTYMFELIADRRASLVADLLSRLLVAEHDGEKLTDDEVLVTCLLLLIAGHETTVNLIANGALALLENPDQLHELLDGEISGRRAVEELLRYDAPVQIVARTATEAVAVAGANVAAGEQVVLLLGSANRDGTVFEDPDRLDLARVLAGRHLAFGSGIHACIGAPLARMEGEIALATLAPLLTHAHLTSAPTYRTEGVLRGLGALPLAC